MKYRGSAAVSAAVILSLLSACGGSSDHSDATPATPVTQPPPPPAAPPVVSVTAPERAGVGVPFTISWTSSDSTSCTTDFDNSTATAASITITETTEGPQTYHVSCSGSGGNVTGSAAVVVVLPSAEGLWFGATGDNRTLSGAVTHEGSFWFVYSAAGDPATPAGFYAGTGSSTAGDFPSANLREFSFEGGSIAAQGTMTATYTHPAGDYSTSSTLMGSFVPPSNVNHDYTITASGSQYYTASGDLGVTYGGTWNDTTGEGSLSGVSTIGLYGLSVDLTQTFKMLPGGTGKGVLRQPSGSTGSCVDTIGGAVCSALGGRFKGTLYNDINYTGGANNTTATATPFSVDPAGTSLTWSFLMQTDQTTDPDTGEVSTFYDAYHLDVTLTPQTLPPVVAGTFSTTYDPLYESAPSLAALAGSFSGSAGIQNSTASATLSVAANGSATGVAGACGYSATLVAHNSGGNIYDVLSLNFTGGGCVYTGIGFTGMARYDAGTQQIVITATNPSRDQGFMFMGSQAH